MDDASLFYPVKHPLRSLLQDGVALRMSDHRSDPSIPQLQKTIGDLHWNAVVAQLHQQVIRIGNNVALGAGEYGLKIVVGEMKIATEAKLGRLADELAKFFEQAGHILTIVMIAVIGVRSGNDVRDAIGHRQSAHFLCDFPGFRPVVHFGQDVAMDIDHVLCTVAKL